MLGESREQKADYKVFRSAKSALAKNKYHVSDTTIYCIIRVHLYVACTVVCWNYIHTPKPLETLTNQGVLQNSWG